MKVNKACKDRSVRPVESFLVSTPIGNMTIRACKMGLHMINQVDELSDENFVPAPKQAVALLSKPPVDSSIEKTVDACISWLKIYFFKPENIAGSTLPPFCVISEEGNYHDQVQLLLAKNVGFGETITYKGLASMTESPGATQSVGSAMRNNPFQLMVPCHRVINSGSKIGVYSGGRRNNTKEWLLRHEGLHVSNGIVSHDKAVE